MNADAPRSIWILSREFGKRIVDSARGDLKFRERMHGYYRDWNVGERDMEAKAGLLLALGLHSLALDRKAETAGDLAEVPAADVVSAVHTRPPQELFVSLPDLDEKDSAAVAQLKLVLLAPASNMRPSDVANHHARLVSSALNYLDNAVRKTAAGNLTCADVLGSV
ncbi:hypothetical protein [Streptomyces sp. NPDC059994]|uniref:hypothetical protein n=1 Tax=Streptomyces sp. NPDC059994 TaxID=3347029 RepID=UPI0036B8DDDC